MRIEELKKYRSSENRYDWEQRPNYNDFIEKINEIIRCLNSITEDDGK